PARRQPLSRLEHHRVAGRLAPLMSAGSAAAPDSATVVPPPTAPTLPPAPAPRHGATIRAALIGNPNTGKSTLFNALTGMRQKVGNFAGVTVERVEGSFHTPDGERVAVLDLPGSYSLSANSPDEEIAL